MCRAQAPCHPDRQFCRPDRSFAVLSVSRRTCYPCHPDRAKRVEGFALQPLLSSKEKWKNAHANKNAFAAFSIPLFFVMVNVGRWHHVIPTERSEWRDLLHRLTFHRKRNGKTLMLSKNAFAAFSIPLSLSNVVAMDALLSPRASVERSDGRGRFLDSSPSDLCSE